jgi:preprotein translocase subunit Sss1
VTSYFEPRFGKNFQKTRLLVMSESAYDWKDGDMVVTPSRTHPQDSVDLWIKNFGKQKYFTAMGRVLTANNNPEEKELIKAWDSCAYTIFVQGSVGLGARKRPTQKQFREAEEHFLDMIERLRPEKIVVTGLTMWKCMPETAVRFLDELQAYRLKDGRLVWCLAVPHPSSSKKGEGFRWEKIAESIRCFKSARLPSAM